MARGLWALGNQTAPGTPGRELLDFSISCVGGEYAGNSFFINRNSYGEVIGSGMDSTLTLRLDDVEVEEEHLRIFCDADKYFIQNLATKQPVWVALRPGEVGGLEEGGGGSARDWLFHSRYKVLAFDPAEGTPLEFRVGTQVFTLGASALSGSAKNRFILKSFLQKYGAERFQSIFGTLKLASLEEIDRTLLEKCELREEGGTRIARENLKEVFDQFVAAVYHNHVYLTLKVEGWTREWVYCRRVGALNCPLTFRIDEKEVVLRFVWVEGCILLGTTIRNSNFTEENRTFVRLASGESMEVYPADEVIIGRQILRLQRINVGLSQLVGTKPTMEDYTVIDQALVVPGLEACCVSLYAIFDGWVNQPQRPGRRQPRNQADRQIHPNRPLRIRSPFDRRFQQLDRGR